MNSTYPFHRDYVRALTTGDIPALRKLIRRVLRARPQTEFFTGDKTGKPLTHFEELATAVWRTFESGHVEHGRLFLNAGLPVDILLPHVDGITFGALWTPLDVTLSPVKGHERGCLQLTQMLLAAGANPRRNIWGEDCALSKTPAYVRSLPVARAFWEYGVPPAAFVQLPAHLRARL